MKHLYVLFIFCFYSVLGQKEPWKVILQSNVNHFSAQEYGGHTQNWDICQGNNQFIYVANSKGLMEFNGIDWKIFSLPGQKVVRSVAVGAEGNIYTGGLGEFGFWKRDVNGLLNYFSLKDQIKDKEFPHEEIWKILVLKDQILFQSFGFMYSYKQNKISDTFFWGLGYWSRANVELLLLATKGKPQRVSNGFSNRYMRNRNYLCCDNRTWILWGTYEIQCRVS